MKIAFARPGASYSSAWLDCWNNTMFYCINNGIEVIDCPAVFHNIHMVRDMCLGINVGRIGQKPFNGELDYTHILWIDSDQIWKPEHLQRLIDADEDIVSGWYTISGTDGRGICAGWYDKKVLEEKGGMPCVTSKDLSAPVINPKGLVDLKAMHPEWEHPWVGMGFMLVKRGVFESIPYPWFFDDCIRVGDVIGNRGDDITFCGKATEAGYRIYIDPKVRVGHQKLAVL